MLYTRYWLLGHILCYLLYCCTFIILPYLVHVVCYMLYVVRNVMLHLMTTRNDMQGSVHHALYFTLIKHNVLFSQVRYFRLYKSNTLYSVHHPYPHAISTHWICDPDVDTRGHHVRNQILKGE